jgi:hypothetical protein
MINVILFRAQPFHNGHAYMIRKAIRDGMANGNEVYVFVGSADKSGTERNPIPIQWRLSLIKGSLYGILSDNEREHIHVYALNDQTDESNNTHEWGEYLYQSIKETTHDDYMTLYYIDEPSIPLSWFGPEEREFVSFKFLPRVDDICATDVREAIKNDDLKRLRYMVPYYVYAHREEIKRYLK